MNYSLMIFVVATAVFARQLFEYFRVHFRLDGHFVGLILRLF